MKKILMIIAMSAILAACDEGSGSGGNASASDDSSVTEESNSVTDDSSSDGQILTQEQIVEKFNLPPEPNAEVNNSTILGIDSNNNDIRDDWERAIAFEHYQNPTMMNINNQRAQNYAALTQAYKDGYTSKYAKLDKKMIELSTCADYFNSDNGFGSNDLYFMKKNTSNRLFFNLKRDADISRFVGYTMSGIDPSQIESVCSKYFK